MCLTKSSGAEIQEAVTVQTMDFCYVRPWPSATSRPPVSSSPRAARSWRRSAWPCRGGHGDTLLLLIDYWGGPSVLHSGSKRASAPWNYGWMDGCWFAPSDERLNWRLNFTRSEEWCLENSVDILGVYGVVCANVVYRRIRSFCWAGKLFQLGSSRRKYIRIGPSN